MLSFVYTPPKKKKKSVCHTGEENNRSTGKHYPSRKANSFSVIQPREVQQKQVQFQKKFLISSEAKKKNQDQETKTKYTL